MFTRRSTVRAIASVSLVLASLLAAQCWSADTKEGYFTTNDGHRLHYIEACSRAHPHGSGRAMLFCNVQSNEPVPAAVVFQVHPIEL